MGCGSSARDKDKAMSPLGKSERQEHENKQIVPEDETTITNKFSLPRTGSVDIHSMEHILKYSGKSKSLEVLSKQNECTTSTLTWITQGKFAELIIE